MGDIESTIIRLKESIANMEQSLAVIYAKIDALECYPNSEGEIEKFEQQTTNLEEQLQETKMQLQSYLDRFSEIKKTEEEIIKAKKEKELLEKQESNNENNVEIIFKVGSLNQAINHLEDKLKRLNSLTNIK